MITLFLLFTTTSLQNHLQSSSISLHPLPFYFSPFYSNFPNIPSQIANASLNIVDTSQIKSCLSFQYGHTKPLTFLKCSIPLTSFHCAVLAFLPNFLASLFLCPWQPSLSVIKLSFILILLYACMILTLSIMCCRTFKLLSLTLFAELQTCKYQRHLKLFNMSKTGSSVLPANTFL